MVLAQKWKYRSTGQHQNLKINPATYGQIIYDKGAKNGEKTLSSIHGTKKIGQLHEKNEIRTFSNTIHKNKFKMD